MKTTYLFFLLFAAMARAEGEFDPHSRFECRLDDGRRILVHDEFAGGLGKALVSDRSGAFHAEIAKASGGLSVGINKGIRAFTNDFNIHLDVANSVLTSRQEGSVRAEYIFVPAQVEIYSVWGGGRLIPAGCIQEKP